MPPSVHHGSTSHGAVVPPFVFADAGTARRYDAWYDTPLGRAVATAEVRLLDNMLTRVPSVRSLLEVGCGTGYFSRIFSQRGLTVTGLDISVGMLSVAAERGGGPRFVLGTAERLPFPDRSVDIVTLITSLEFVSDPLAALQEAGRVARRGVLLGVLNLASLLGLRRKLMARFRPSPYRDARFFTPWQLARMVRRSAPGRVQAITWRTSLWPVALSTGAQRLPFGGFIGLLATLDAATSGGVPCQASQRR